MGYKSLSLIQFIFIFLCAFSLLDFGYVQTSGEVDGLVFNKLLFDTNDGIIGPLFDGIDFWGIIQFWAFCFFIVAICQLLKALQSSD
ncbi:MAG: hypothetical protein ACXACP_10385 [Candidatus Hodarchaeales archaeon]|jgi:hypothetical protein